MPITTSNTVGLGPDVRVDRGLRFAQQTRSGQPRIHSPICVLDNKLALAYGECQQTRGVTRNYVRTGFTWPGDCCHDLNIRQRRQNRPMASQPPP